jgi:hypothetical protein
VTVGFFAPLPPARTGVAAYASVLLRHLRGRGHVEVEPGRADVNLYHLGNNQLHREIYRRAILEPGVVVLHDAVLHHFFLGVLSEADYVEEFVYNYGEWTRDLAVTFWRRRAGSATDNRYFQYPMLRRVCETSRCVIVHNPAAAASARRHAPQSRIVEIPHLFEPPPEPSPAKIAQTRRGLGLDQQTILAGVFGHLRESKRILPILRAFERLHSDQAVFLLAGDIGSRDLSRAIEPFLTATNIRRIPYLPEHDFWSLAFATDICLNLRYPAAGESSGIATRFMGIGKPVFLTDSEEVSRIPETACIRIESGMREEAQVEDILRWLCRMPHYGREIGANAASYVREYHSIDPIADLYWHTLSDAR